MLAFPRSNALRNDMIDNVTSPNIISSPSSSSTSVPVVEGENVDTVQKAEYGHCSDKCANLNVAVCFLVFNFRGVSDRL